MTHIGTSCYKINAAFYFLARTTLPLVFERVSDQASCAMSTDSRLLNIRPTVTALAASFALWATVWVRSCGGQRDTRTGPTAATTTFQRLNYIIFVKMI